jgi:hypothetical protein
MFRFSSFVVPGDQHGTEGIGNQKRTPTPYVSGPLRRLTIE